MELTDARPDPHLCLPLQQHPLYADALRLMGCDAGIVSIREGSHHRGHVVWLQRRFGLFGVLGMASLGPVWAEGTSIARRVTLLRRLARERLWIVNSEQDDRALNGAGYRCILTGQILARLDISRDSDRQRARLHQKWRNRWAQGDRGLDIGAVPFDETVHHWLLQAEQKRAQNLGYRTLPIGLVGAVRRAAPDALRLFTARSAPNRTEAAMLFICHGPVATYHIGWTSDEGRRAEAHRQILVHAIDWLAHRGIRRLDLGTLDTEHAPGLARFKLGTGARPVALDGTWLKLPLL